MKLTFIIMFGILLCGCAPKNVPQTDEQIMTLFNKMKELQSEVDQCRAK